MATTLPSNMKWSDSFTQTGYVETLTQDIEKFNAGSAGTLNLATVRKIGDFDHATMFKHVPDLVSRQDQTSTAAVAAKRLEQGQYSSVKLNRKVGPVEWTLSSLRKPGLNPNAIKVAAGEMIAKQVLANMLNTSLFALKAALGAQAAVNYDAGADKLSAEGLATGFSKFGDASSRVKALVMHSKAYWDLVKTQINPATHGDTVAGAVVAGANPASLGRPIIVTDSEALFDTATGTYFTLGLVGDAATVEESEDTIMAVDGPITGFEQLIMRVQGEFAYNLGLRGFTWDVANGGKNPLDAALATAANWDPYLGSHKDLAGIVISHK